MISLAEKIVSRITVDYSSITVVKNPDGFLATDVVRSWLSQTGVRIVSGSQLALRVDYELNGKSCEDGKTVYLCQQPELFLPDMRQLPQVSFSLSDLFPLLPDKQVIRTLSIAVLELLFARQGIRRMSLVEQQVLTANVQREVEENKQKSIDGFAERVVRTIPATDEWANLHKATEAVSSIVADAAKVCMYENIEDLLAPVNEQFQEWVDTHYFAELNANPVLRPHSVNKILAHLDAAYAKNDKVALVVVDGFSYWQYQVLREYLHKAGIETEDKVTLAWIPTITMLSRQAIFRGDVPQQDYQQNPQNERKLWSEHWSQQGFASYEVQYLYDTDEFVIQPDVKRLAVVTVELDEKMHSSTDYRDLYSLTENWCARFVRKIQAIRAAGFSICLTTDHGNLYSHGAASLTAQEKVYLYKDGSRGKRHLIYKDTAEQSRFYEEHSASMPMLKHDNWLAIRNAGCFDRAGATGITHGGSHWMEVVIPFVKIP